VAEVRAVSKTLVLGIQDSKKISNRLCDSHTRALRISSQSQAPLDVMQCLNQAVPNNRDISPCGGQQSFARFAQLSHLALSGESRRA